MRRVGEEYSKFKEERFEFAEEMFESSCQVEAVKGKEKLVASSEMTKILR